MIGAGPFPIVARANSHQFGPGESFSYARVESRMVLVGQAGDGRVQVNGKWHEMQPRRILVMPWGHSVRYEAADLDPYLLIGAHLIPEHEVGYEVEASVPHDPDHHLSGCRWRRDGDASPVGTVAVSSGDEHPGLVHIVGYAVEVFRRGVPNEHVMRSLGTLVLGELSELSTPGRAHYAPTVPDDLRRVLHYIDQSLDKRLTIGKLARIASCSPATLSRRFRRHLSTSPMDWITIRRIARAQELLRTTGLTIGQVARRCGVNDPYYFSRLFRNHVGESPQVWRRGQHIL